MPERVHMPNGTLPPAVKDLPQPVCALSGQLNTDGRERGTGADKQLKPQSVEMEQDQVCTIGISPGMHQWAVGTDFPTVMAQDCLACQVPPEICQGKQLQALLDKYTRALGRRVKELNCLYGISAVVEQPGISLPQILKETIALLRASWQHPETTCVRIELEGQTYATENWQDSDQKLVQGLFVQDRQVGYLEVGYLGQQLEGDSPPFLPEEARLLKAVAEQVGQIIERLRAQDRLRQNERLLRTIAENVPAFLSIVRRAEDGLRVNFAAGRESRRLGLDPAASEGRSLEEVFGDQTPLVEAHFLRALAGQEVSLELKVNDRYLLYDANCLDCQDGPGERIMVVVQDVTERKQLQEQAIQAAATAERERLARDLHDAVTQSLFLAASIAETLPHVWESQPEQARLRLADMRRLAHSALAEMRILLLELRPEALAEQPLGHLLRGLVNGMEGRTRTSVTMTQVGDCILPEDVKIALYRIGQEALGNIAKHARAKNASVSLLCDAESDRPEGIQRVTLSVRDEGQGIEERKTQNGGLGMGIMRERAAIIGAGFVLNSRPGHGTEITVTWPGQGGKP